MSLDTLLVHTVTIIRSGWTTDRYGDSIQSWATATETTTKGWLSQDTHTENLDGRDALISSWVLYVPASADINGRDRVRWEDVDPTVTFEVTGPPLPAWSPRLRGIHHHEVHLSVVEG